MFKLFNENEVAMLLLCIGVFIFIITKRREYKRIPHWKFIVAAFYIFFAGVILTVVEAFIFEDLLNVLEHCLYILSSFILMLWCWKTFHHRKEGKQ